MDSASTDYAPLKTVQLSWEWRVGLAVVLLGFGFACSCIAGWYFLLGNVGPVVDAMMEAIFIAMAAGCACLAWAAWRYQIAVWPDRIWWTNGFFSRSLQRSEIRGFRNNSHAQNTWLIPKDDQAKSITIPTSLLSDPASEQFFHGLPDLNVEDLQRGTEELENDPRLGTSPEERRSRLQRFRTIASVLNGAGIGIFLWVWIWPRPYNVAIYAALCAFPLAVLVNFWSRSLIDLGENENDPKPTIHNLYFFSAIAVALRALLDIDLLDVQAELTWAAIFGLALSAFMFLYNDAVRKSVGIFALYAILNFAYAYGALAELDYLLDHSAPEIFRTQVLSMRVDSGKSTSYHVTVERWSSYPAGTDVKVSRAYYESVHNGQTVCIYLGNGYLGFRYIEIGNCPA